MSLIQVTLYTEQTATLVVEADKDATDAELTRLALLELEASGGAEWLTRAGWVEHREVLK